MPGEQGFLPAGDPQSRLAEPRTGRPRPATPGAADTRPEARTWGRDSLRPPHPAAWRLAWLLLALLFAAPAPASSQARVPAASPEEGAIKVVVAVLPFRVHSARPLDYLESSLADLLASRLESSGRVRVLETVTVRESLVAHGGERTEDALRRLAREVGADFVVAGSVTELAGQYSLDVRVTPVGRRYTSQTLVFTAGSDDELLDRVNELADRVLELVGSGAPEARIAEVRVEGAAGPLGEEARARVELAEGDRYRSAEARRDLARLRELAGIASATVETERRPDGVVVTYRVVPRERILPGPEAAAAEGERVAGVTVRGNKRIESSAIRARITTREGDVFDAGRVAADVRALYELGFFSDVRVLSEEAEDGRLLVFEVRENAVVRQVTISGNDSVPSDEIRDKLTLTTGSTLDYPLLFENKERIETIYRAQGFYLAKVTYTIESMPGDAVSIDFEVNEGDKLRLRRIVFEGNEAFTDEELVDGLDTKAWRWYSHVSRFLDRSGTYAEPVFLQDLQGVHERYLNRGFLEVEVGEPVVRAEEDGLVVGVEITEGPQFRVGRIALEGDDTMDLDGLRERIGLEEGEVFDRSQLTRDVERLEANYTDQGFFLARVSPLTDVDDQGRVVDVSFQVEKGPLYFIREIDVAGNTTTVDPVIRREMRVVEGQLYSARALGLSEGRIRRLGYFEEVNFETQPTDDPEELDIDVQVVERPTGSLSFGAGFSSQDRFVLTGSLSQSNLFGRGYGVSLSADIGGRSDRFFFSFTDPYFLGTDFSLTSRLFSTEVEFDDFEQAQSGVEFTLGHALNLEGTSRGFLRYNWSDREINEEDGVNAAGVIFRELLSDSQSSSLLGLAYRSDTRDDRFAPSRGRILGFSVEGAGLGGFSKFLRLEGQGIFFAKPPEWFPRWVPFRDRSSFVLGIRGGWALPFNDIGDFDFIDTAPGDAIRLDGSGCDPLTFADGSVQTCELAAIDDDVELPLSERYFLGGLGTFQLRGFEARTVGPRRAVLTQNRSGTGTLFTPVGRDPLTGACNDVPGAVVNLQGDGDGQCNSIDDSDIDDFDDIDETDVIGGNKFLSLSTEYRFPLSEALGLVGILFFDTGNAFAEDENYWDFDLWRFGTGFGVQWFSPFGPLQAFVGFPLDKLEVEDSPVFEFSVGGASF